MKKQKFISLLCAGSMLAAQGSVFAASTDKVYTTDNEKSIDFGKTFLGYVYGLGDTDNLKTFNFADLFGGTVVEPTTYTVTVTAGANGSAVADVTEAEEGDIVTLTVDPDEGYELDAITGVDATKVDDTTYTFTMPAEAVTVNVTFVALPVEDTDTAPVYPGEEPFTKTFKFEELFGGTVVEPTTYTVTVTAGANGSAVADVTEAEEGDIVTLTVDPDEGYELDAITGVTATKVDDTTYTFTMPAEAVTVNVTFKAIPVVIEKYNVSVGTVENGTVELSATGEVEENTVVTVTATPAEGYQLVEILVNGQAIEGTTFTVTEDAVVTATFEAIPVDRITIPSTKNGEVTVDKEAPAAGEEVTITIEADKGYKLTKLEVKDSEGNDVTVTDNKFTMPENNITITAEFEAIEYKVEIEVGKNGDAEFTVEGEEAEIAVIGDDIDISVDPNRNYTLKKITYSYVDEKGNTKTVTVRNKTFKMPAYDVVIEVTFEKKATSGSSGGSGGGLGIILPSDGTLTPEETITEIIFDDVAEGTWYEADIDYVAEKGIMTGVADRTFDPNGVVTRAMVVATLQRLEAPYYENTNTPFTDVTADAWYAKSVAWAYENGIVKGMSDTEYAPDALVTREQLAAILDRYVDAYHKEIDATADISGYVDSALVSDWAVESVASAVGMGIISGTDAGELNPLGNATRAEYATMLSRCMRKIGK